MIPAIKTQHRMEISRLGATFPADLDAGEWKAIWKDLQTIDASLNFIIGDWLNFGQAKFGEKYLAALSLTDWQYQRLRNASYVCAQVQLSSRKDNLDWSHHVVIAPLEQSEQQKFLALAEQHEWTVSQLRVAVRQAQSTRLRSSAKGLGFVPAAWIAEGMRWFRQQEIDEWPEDRREALRQQLKPLADIYGSLAGSHQYAK